MAVATEIEIMIGRRAWPEAQRIFSAAGVPQSTRPGVAVGWHGTSVEAESGAFAVVRDGAGLDDLIGQIVRVVRDDMDREAFVYVLGARSAAQDLSLSRRAFLSLGLLAYEAIGCTVEVIR